MTQDFSLKEIKRRLKHRYPFLLVDRILELEEGKRCRALKNVTGNEAFFQGHFPGQPIFPGVLIVEALAQAAGIASYALAEDADKLHTFFVGMDNVRFKNPVIPGDQLILETEVVNRRRNILFLKGEALVDGKVVASAEFKIATVPVDPDSRL